MKTLLHLKTIDLLVQAVTLLISILYFAYELKFDSLYVFYFLVGSNQVLSCIINIFLDKRLRDGHRKAYEVLLVFLGALAIFSFVLFALKVDAGRVFAAILMFCLVYLSPGFAVWYFIITIQDFINIRRYASRKIHIPNN